MSIFDYNGSAVVAMVGKDCVGVACDRRLGANQLQTVSCDFPKVFEFGENTLVGLPGLATDVQTVHDHLRFRLNLYALKEDRQMRPRVVANLLSTMLYGRRFSPWFLSPVVAGLDPVEGPFVTAFDLLGASSRAEDFVVGGTSSEQLYGVSESFWRPDMDPDQLFETLSQCILAGVDRDCLAGWGAVVRILTKDKLITKTLKGRMD